jgi:hypothetical protein
MTPGMCLQRAEGCRDYADQAHAETDRETWLGMADKWEELAFEILEREVERGGAGAPQGGDIATERPTT